jgi:fibronectin-binding autotransporter adhesin
VVNNGLIRADVPGQTLRVGAQLESAGGTLRAENGGSLSVEQLRTLGQASVSGTDSYLFLGGVFNNGGTINVTDGGRLGLNGQWTNSGSINLVNGTLDLWSGPGNAVFSNITNNGGSVRVRGRIDARGTTLTVPSGLNLDVQSEVWSNSLVLPTSETITVRSGGGLAQASIVGTGHIRLLGGGVGGETGQSPNPLTIPSTVTISGYGGVGGQPLTNNGTILANVDGLILNVGGSVFTNNGLLEASNGGSLGLSGTWTNAGTIRTRDHSVLNLNGNYTFSGGTIEALDTSVIRLGGTLNNTGSTLNAAGNIQLQNGVTINGGTINVPGAPLRINPANTGAQVTLSGVTLNGEFGLEGGSGNFGRILKLRDGLTGNGVVHMTGTASTIAFENSQTIDGVTLFADSADTATNRRMGLLNPNLTITLGPTGTIRGGNATIFDPNIGGGLNSTFINQGTVRADVAGQMITLRPGTMTSSGLLEATNGGILRMGDPTSGTPLPSWSSTGTMRAASGGVLRLGGMFTIDNPIENDGGSVELFGTLDNTGRTLNLAGPGNAISLVDFWGTIQGGIVNSTENGLRFPAGRGGGSLVDVTVNGDILAAAPVSVGLGTTVNGVITVVPGGSVSLGPAQSAVPFLLTSEVRFDAVGANPAPIVGSDNLVIAPTGVIRGGTGIVSRRPGSSGNWTTVNQGRIAADTPGGFIQVNRIDNSGTLEALNGGHLAVSGTYRPEGTIRVINSTLTATNLTPAALAGMERSGATINLAGLFDNSGHTLNLDASTTWGMNGLHLKGGTVNRATGAALTSTGATFDNLTFNGDLHGDHTFRGITLNGMLTLSAPDSTVTFMGSQAFNAGTIFFDPTITGNDRRLTLRGLGVNGAGFSTVTMGPAATIRGGRGLIRLGWGAGALGTLINHGLVSADIGGTAINIEQQRFVNHGTVQAINGGSIQYQGPGPIYDGTDVVNPIEFYNTGLLSAGANSLLAFDVLLSDPYASIRLAAGELGNGRIMAREIIFDGHLTIVPSGQLDLIVGTRYDLFDFATASGSFSTLTLPELGGGLTWDASHLYSDGSLRIVPAPSSAAALGLLLLGSLRRRRKS